MYAHVRLFLSLIRDRALLQSSSLAIIAYIGSFLLIRYRLTDAQRKEADTEHPGFPPPRPQADQPVELLSMPPAFAFPCTADHEWSAYTDLRSLVSVQQVRPFAFRLPWPCGARAPCTQAIACGTPACEPDPEKAAAPASALSDADRALATLHAIVRTLSRFHVLVAALALLGFVLALIGALGYFWTGLPVGLGIFASVCLGGSLVAGALAMM